ncbi:dihydrodipicolinate synthase family protein [Boudabousia tangfeifanii]|uniref:Dihydrodipicolinate synthase family protein n=1 Tax=Boudabousia tangfeifanii TaxID=1912795 RepID=A0A1D9MKJ6_9ACTO|nr:dihydrodipicolinate synthase family protein [Boudabousia tangfeifanii]AOZ72748.1 dihydrodipicolinate synthase family protein [Boudabousia tangfeifanii]
MTEKLTGIIPPVLTPLNADGSVDEAALTKLVNYLIDSGVDGLFVLGSSGEVVYLTDEQREQVLRVTTEVAAGRVPILAGVIDMTTNRVLEQIKRAEKYPIDAIVVTAPFYIRTAMDEVETHFRTIAAATKLPVWAYDIPVCVGTKLPAAFLVRMGVEGVLAGVKDSSGDDVGFRRLVLANKAAGSPLQCFTGHEVVVDCMALLGADGAVPGLGNVDPAGYVRLWKAAKAGDWDKAREEQDRLANLFEMVFQASTLGGGAAGVGSFKTSLAAMGVFSHNRMSTPATRIEGDAADRIVSLVKEAGLL